MGGEIIVNLILINNGGDLCEVVLIDLLNMFELCDFVFVSGSVCLGGNVRDVVIEYIVDGSSWNMV